MRLMGIGICLIGIVLSGSHDAEALAQWPSFYIYLRDGSKIFARPLIKVDDSYVEYGIPSREGLVKDKVARSELWLRYAAALQNQWRYRRPVSLNNQKEIELDVDQEKLSANLPTALAALQKAVELANDCETKSSAMKQLSLVYSDAGEMEKSRDWALKSATLPCAGSKLAPARETRIRK
jgi:hypothetical protein